MSNLIENFREQAAAIETPFTIRHVESHLIFGPLSRHLPVAYLAIAATCISLTFAIISNDKPLAIYIGSILDELFFIIPCLMLFVLSRRQQAIVTWGIFKFTLGLVAFSLAFVGGIVGFLRAQPDAWPNLILGIIWLPGIEFISNITPQQRYVTLARIILSIPCIYYGIQSGNWHW